MEGLTLELTHTNSPYFSRKEVDWLYQGIKINTNDALIWKATGWMMSLIDSSDKSIRIIYDKYESPLIAIELLNWDRKVLDPYVRVIFLKKEAIRTYVTETEWQETLKEKEGLVIAPVNLKGLRIENSVLYRLLPDINTEWAFVQFIPQWKNDNENNEYDDENVGQDEEEAS